MADLFIVKERLKFSLKLTSIGVLLSALASWYFYGQIEFDTDRNQFLLAAVITGALVVGWFGLLLFFLLAKRITNPAHNFTDRFSHQAWWFIKILLLLGVIGISTFFISRYSDQAESEYDLIRIGHLDALQERIQQQPTVLTKEDAQGRTLLQVAYQENFPEAVAMLIQNGAEAFDLDPQGRNVVIASMDNPPMLQALLDSGLDPNINDADGIPAIHHAVALHSSEVLRMLLEAGARVDRRDRLSRTPLMRAIERDDSARVELLVEQHAAVNTFDQRGDTPLHMAVRKRSPDMVRLLLNQGADAQTFNFTHMTPLHLAALAGNDELVLLFLETPNLTGLHDETDRTPFDFALEARKYETATLLMDAGADPDRILMDGRTRLHQAIQGKDYRTARFLIRAGADAKVPDQDGRTALDLIRAKQLSGLEELIFAREADAGLSNTVDSAEAP